MKKLCIIAAILLVVGIVLCALGLGMTGAHWKDSFVGELTDKTIDIGEDFSNIQINTDTTDVVFSLSEDGGCRILCRETEHQPHTAKVENGTLILRQENNRKWYHYIGFHFETPSAEIQLPKKAFETLTLEGDTGDVVIPQELTFANVKIDSSTGKVDVRSQVEKTLAVQLSTGNILVSGAECETVNVKTSTGEIRILGVNCESLTAKSSTGRQLLENVQASENIQLTCSTGNIHFTRGSCRNLTTESSTGRQNMEYVVASGDVAMTSDTGDISLADFDAATMVIATDTGDVSGTILSEKIFFTETDTGRVEVPRCTGGGSCEITTDTGDIIIQIP